MSAADRAQLVQVLELKGANGVTTPGENEAWGQEEVNEVDVSPEEATNYRSIADRAKYLSADRPDIMYAVKELCRGMAKPTKARWLKLCLLYTSPSPREATLSRMPSSA